MFAIILAAGQGTRMKSAVPKVLHRVLGRTMVGHMVATARLAGATRVVIVVGHGREEVEACVRAEHDGDDLHFVVQAEQLGTAHAVSMAGPVLKGAEGMTLILNGDVPNFGGQTVTDFVATVRDAGTQVGFVSTHVPNPTGYGRIVRDEHGEVLRNVEHRDASPDEREIDEINAGLYLVDNAFLWEALSQIGADNDQGEFYLPDLFALARAHGGATPFVVADHREVEGVNNRAQLAMAETFARARRNEALMLSGVTMLDPASITVEADATVAPDVLIEANVRLMGATRVASGCVLRQGSVIEDSDLEESVVIKPYCHLESAVVRQGAQVGPFAHLRTQSDIGPGAKVGNFVETKKTKLGAGSKASHLTYLGDATIGDGCNIGAGTITCNYDGYNKHPTVLEDGVFIGSNSALVAPIHLKKGAYVAAGSTLTQNVPEDSLGVARGRQRNIEEWARRWRRQNN